VNDCSIKCNVYPGVAGAPVAVYIHGGALIFGGRNDVPEPSIKPFMEAGYWIISINYRLAPETKLPFIIEDVRDALDWVRGDGSRKFNYDASRKVVIGASAGGYLALMTGTFEIKPNVIVSLYGYGDILGDWYAKPSPHYCNEPLVSHEEAGRLIREGAFVTNSLVSKLHNYNRRNSKKCPSSRARNINEFRQMSQVEKVREVVRA
jgi:hypothetical protein